MSYGQSDDMKADAIVATRFTFHSIYIFGDACNFLLKRKKMATALCELNQFICTKCSLFTTN